MKAVAFLVVVSDVSANNFTPLAALARKPLRQCEKCAPASPLAGCAERLILRVLLAA